MVFLLSLISKNDMIKTKKLANWLDDQVDFKKLIGGIVGTLAESSDGFLFAKSLEFAAEKLPEKFHDEINEFIDGVVDKDYGKIKFASTEQLVSLIKSPLGDYRERVIIGGLINIVFDLLDIEKQRIILTYKNESVGGGGPSGDPDD